MVTLKSSEKAFVDERGKFVRSWPLVGAAMLIVVFGLAAWLWISTPYLINPWAVVAGLDSGSIPESHRYLTIWKIACRLGNFSMVMLPN